eukprot:238614-Rhodomonas_salina.1
MCDTLAKSPASSAHSSPRLPRPARSHRTVRLTAALEESKVTSAGETAAIAIASSTSIPSSSKTTMRARTGADTAAAGRTWICVSEP